MNQLYYVQMQCITTGQLYKMPVAAPDIAEAYRKATDYPYVSNWLIVTSEKGVKQ